jgi:HAE1 family hydrophobic/amphiphilic exporter-1
VNLSEPFIRRPVMTVVLTVSVILFGVMAYLRLPVNDLPAVDYPVIQVTVGYPGASPTTVANTIATPLERQFLQIPGIERITSQSMQGSCSLTLQFSLSKNIDAAATDVQTMISQATQFLPVDLPAPPTFRKTNPNDQPIQYIALTSNTVTAGQLYDYAYTQVAQRISIISGVSRVDVYGTKSAVRIKVNPSAMAIRGITVDDLSQSITKGTSYQSAGQFDGSHRSFLLQPKGQLATAAEYNDLIVAMKNGAPVRLRDVAEARDTLMDERSEMHFWARGVQVPTATVVLAVSRQAGANVVQVAGAVRELLPQINQQLPAAVHLTLIYDRSAGIIHSVIDVQLTLAIAFVLVVMVIFVFLGRAADTLIPVVAMPLSLLLTFVAMYILGYSVDNLSLMALTLAIGFLVDDAIVFLENTVRRMEAGESAVTAAVHSAREISFTILSMTISLAAVFIPLVFMSGIIGRLFREFAVTIMVAIFASGVVSLTLTPLMCARMLARRGKELHPTWMERLTGRVIRGTLGVYGRSLTWFLRHRWVSAVVWFACLAGTVWLFMAVPKSFLPIGDSGFMWGMLLGQEGDSPERMHGYQKRADAILHDNQNVDMTFTMTGATGYFPSNQGMLLAFLSERDKRPPIQVVAGELMGALNTNPGTIAVLQPQPVLQVSASAVPQLQGQYAFSISGVDPGEVYATAGKLMEKLGKFPGFASVMPDLYMNTPNLDIEILRDQASTYGVSVQKIENLLRLAYSQNYLYLIKKAEDQYQVILEVADDVRANPEDLSVLYVRSDDGKNMVPLSAVTRWKQSIGPQAVNHINSFTSVTIFFNLKPDTPIGDAVNFINDAAAETLPPGVRGSLEGEAKDFRETVSTLVVLMFLAVFVMYVVLGILYESYLHPLTVLSSLPVALVGGLLTLFLFRAEASLYAFIGMFMLMGIVKKNGIMMIDFALQRLAEGKSRVEAIYEASMERFRPIMMTTLAALMGAVPIALGFGNDGESRRPLGLVIVGGLIVSQFITLYITPVIYLYLEGFQERVLDRTSFFRQTRLKPATVPAAVSANGEAEVVKVTAGKA